MKSQIIESAKSALAECLNTIRAEDALAYKNIAQALHSGAMAQIQVSLSMAGLAQTDINLIALDGTNCHLGHFEYEAINSH